MPRTLPASTPPAVAPDAGAPLPPRRRRWQRAALFDAGAVALFCLAVLAMGFAGEYQRFVGVQILVASLVAVSFRGLFRAGVFSLAGPAFMGVGAYGYALAQLELGWPPAAAMGLAIAGSFVVACLVGPIVWRVSRIYLALLTLSLGIILTMIYGELRVTGGHGGRYGVEPVTAGGVELWRWFLFSLGLSGALLLALSWLEHSRLGRAWRAIGIDPAFAESVGVRSGAHAFSAFALFSTLAAVAGILLAANNGYVYPEAFGFERVVFMLLCVFVGGASAFVGPLLGAIFVGWLQESLSGYAEYTMMILGTVLVLVILIIPDGLVSLPRAVRTFLARPRRRVEADEKGPIS